MTLREAVRSMVDDTVKFKGIRIGNIVSVDDGTRTCVVNVLDSETDIEGVRLHVTGTTSSGAYFKPAIGSLVGIAPLFSFEYAVVLYSDLDEIVFLDGSYGGLVKVNDLVTKVNNLENQVNDLLSALQGVSIPLAPSGTYPFAPLFSSFTPLTPTMPDDIQSQVITHGTV